MLLADMISSKQKEDPKEIRFEGLLHVNLLKSSHRIIPWCIKQLSAKISVFIMNETAKFTITTFDICDSFALPIDESNPIVETSRQRKNNPNSYLVKQWRENLDGLGSRKISSQEFFDKIVSDLKDRGPDFKRFFIMHVMIIYFGPNPY